MISGLSLRSNDRRAVNEHIHGGTWRSLFLARFSELNDEAEISFGLIVDSWLCERLREYRHGDHSDSRGISCNLLCERLSSSKLGS